MHTGTGNYMCVFWTSCKMYVARKLGCIYGQCGAWKGGGWASSHARAVMGVVILRDATCSAVLSILSTKPGAHNQLNPGRARRGDTWISSTTTGRWRREIWGLYTSLRRHIRIKRNFARGSNRRGVPGRADVIRHPISPYQMWDRADISECQLFGSVPYRG